MVPVITEGGRSFKGAALYFLHDKRQEGEAERLTSDRVAWSEAVNLPTNDPERAWRMMAHTALAQADLKAAAGTKATGRKLAKPVFAYSLAWHEDDRPTREDQLEAARDTLKALGLEDRQALIVCHRDTKHPHVHVIVNRVSPTNGIAAPLSKSKEVLQAWALKYQQQRGQTHCPARAEKAKKREQGQKTERAPRVPRPAFEFEKATGNDNLVAKFVEVDQQQQDAQLYAIGRSVKASHARQWDELKRVYEVAKARLYDHGDQLKTRKAGEIKEASKPRWKELFKQQRMERQAFEQREDGMLSRLFNMVATLRELRRESPDADTLTTLFTVLSGRQRRNTLTAIHERERRDLALTIKNEIRAAEAVIRKEVGRDVAKLRGQFMGQSAALRQTHAEQRAAMSAAWTTRNAERKAALAPSRGQATGRTVTQGKGGEGRSRTRSIEDGPRSKPTGGGWQPR